MDVVVASGAQLTVMPGHGDGSFAAGVTVTGPWSTAIQHAFTDLTGAGKPALVVGDKNISVLLRQ